VRNVRLSSMVSGVVTTAVLIAPISALAAVSISGTLTTTGSPTTSPRVIRNGTASTCAAPKTFPGNAGSGNYHFDSYHLQNGPIAQCVTVTATASSDAGCATAGPFPVLYDGVFAPTSLSGGYLADSGSSTSAGSPVNLAVNLASNQDVSLVIFPASNTATNASCSYTISSAELSVFGSPAPTAIPTLQQWMFFALATALAGAGAVVMRRRRQSEA
jgi:hypothetical protein